MSSLIKLIAGRLYLGRGDRVGQKRATWIPWKEAVFPKAPEGATVRGFRSVDTARIACPICDRWFSLVEHHIDDNGNCFPSVVCPHKPCNFHLVVTLEGWSR